MKLRPLIYWHPTWLRRTVLVLAFLPLLFVSSLYEVFIKCLPELFVDLVSSFKSAWRGVKDIDTWN